MERGALELEELGTAKPPSAPGPFAKTEALEGKGKGKLSSQQSTVDSQQWLTVASARFSRLIARPRS